MKVAILTSILAAFSHLAFSIPVSEVGSWFSSLQSRSPKTIYPVTLVPIMKDSPDKNFGSSQTGIVYRQGGQHDINTFVTFMLDTGFPGKLCSLEFNGIAPTIKGGNLINVYSVAGTLGTTETWNNRPQQGQLWGTLNVTENSAINSWSPSIPTFNCPGQGPATLRFELAPASDHVDMTFPLLLNGLALNIS